MPSRSHRDLRAHRGDPALQSEAERSQRANATEFGLAGYVFTESIDRALNVADRLETGLVGINRGPSNAAAPFGGVKQSGLAAKAAAKD